MLFDGVGRRYQRNGEDMSVRDYLVLAVVNCRLCRATNCYGYLLVFASCKRPINLIADSNPVTHAYDNILVTEVYKITIHLLWRGQS
jgi:hypothetical protein